MATIAKMSQRAQRYYLHDHDENHSTGEKCCYFCETGRYGEPIDGWGVWIDRNGRVDVDDVSANGEQPSASLLAVLKIAARKHLST